MSEDYQRIELITRTARRRYWSTEQKLRVIEQSFEPGETVSSVARRHCAATNLLYRWRRLMSGGGATAVGSDEPVVGSSEVRKLEERVRELSACLAAKPWRMNSSARRWPSRTQKTDLAVAVVAERRFPMKRVAEALGVSRSNLADKARGRTPAARSLREG